MSCKKSPTIRLISMGALCLVLLGAFVPQALFAEDAGSSDGVTQEAVLGDRGSDANEDLSTSSAADDFDGSSGDTPTVIEEQPKSVLDYARENIDTIADGSRVVISPCNASRKALDVAGGSRANGGNVQSYTSNMTAAQLWDVSQDASGFLTFKNVGSGLVLDLSAGRAMAGQNIQQYASNGTLAQKWIAVKNDDGSVVIHSAVDFDYVLDIAGGSSANGANLQLYKANGTPAQSFSLFGAQVQVASAGRTVADGVYFLISANGALDVAGASGAAGATLQVYAANGTVAQAFRLTFDEGSGFYTIASMISGRLLDAEYGSVVPGGAVHQYGSLDDSSSYSRNRLWAVTEVDGKLIIQNAANGYYLTSAGSNVSTTADSQSWSFAEAPTYTWTAADVDRFAALHAGEISDGEYALCMTKAFHSVLDVAGGSMSVGANLQIYGSNSTTAQRWKITNILDAQGKPTGYVTIASSKSNLVLDVSGGSKVSGANVQQYSSNGTAAQKWIAVKQFDGSYVFYSGLGRRLVMDVYGGSVQNGANVQVYLDNGSAAQRFLAVNSHPTVAAGAKVVDEGMYNVVSAESPSTCFDVAGAASSNGAVVQTYQSNGTLAQGFKLIFDASTGFYSIRNVAMGKGLDLDSGDILPGAKVQMWDYPGVASNQQWRIEQLKDGNYLIRSVASNLVLVRLSSGKLTTAVADGSLSQEWKFAPFVYSLAEGCYSLYSAAANKYVDVCGGSYAEGAALQVYVGNGTMAQKWWARKCDDGTYTFQCVNSAKYLSSRLSDGGMTQTADSNDSSAHWTIEVLFGKGLALKNVQSGRYLSFSGGSGSIYALDLNGSNSQVWSFNTTPVVPEGFYEIAPSHALGSRLDIAAGSRTNGANAQIYASNGTLSQRYWLRGVGNGWYSLTACCSAYPLDVLNCGTADGSNVQQWQWNGSNAQRWRFEMGQHGIKIISACGNKVLDVSGGNAGNGANVQIWSYNGTAAQGWRFISAERPAKIGYQNPSQYPQVSSLTVRLPSYCTGEFTYVTPSRIAIDATRDDCVNAFIQRAYEYIGTQYIEPYSTAPGGAVDCSGFVLQCLYATGMDMGIYNPYNHRWLAWQTYNSMNWYNNGTFMPVSVNAMQRGDVIYYRGHIAIYLGNGRMIDSWPRQGVGIHGVYERGNPIGAARPFV